MIQYQKYLVKENDQFDPAVFSFVENDVITIREQTHHVIPSFKAEILLSYLKTHKLDEEWVKVNPELAKLIKSGSLATQNIESLFDSCQNKKSFRDQMEAYLKKAFSE